MGLTQQQYAKILNAITEHDRKAAGKRGYNRFALAHYAGALDNVRRHCDAGRDLRDAVITCYLGRLCDKVLVALGLPVMTEAEARHGLETPLPELIEVDEEECTVAD